MVGVDPILCKDENSIKLGYLRKSFRQYYPNIYERLTYAVVKEESMSVIKQIIQLSLNEKETVVPFTKRNSEDKKYNNQPYNTQPVYKRKCILCGSTEHVLYQCDMKDSFYDWKKIEKEKQLKKKTMKKVTILKPMKKALSITIMIFNWMGGWFRWHSDYNQSTILNYWNQKKIKYIIINFLNNKINESNISRKLKIKLGSEILNIDNAVLFQNGRRTFLSIIDLLDNNINCIFYNQNNKKYLKLF